MADGVTSSRRLVLAALGIAAAASATCRPAPDAHLAPGVVALVDGDEITAQDLRDAYWASEDGVRDRVARAGGRHFLLDLVISDALLAREARARRLALRYSDMHAFHETLMRRFLAAELDPTVRPEDVLETVVRAEYDRLAPGLAISHRRHLRVLAHDALESAEAMIADVAATVSREGVAGVERRIESGEIRTRYGHDAVFDLESATAALGAEVAEAGFALDPAAVVVSQPIRYRGRWGVVIVRGDFPALPAPAFEEVAGQIRNHLHQEARERALNAFVETFRIEHLVVRRDENLDLVPWVPAADETARPSEEL